MKFRVPILMYHHVEPKPLDPEPRFGESYLSRAELADQLDWLDDQGYNAITLEEALRRHATGTRRKHKSLVLTFDDGCRCFREHAVPELERRGMAATVFAVTDRVGGQNSWDLELGERLEHLMTAEELTDVGARGFEVGSHTQSHADLTKSGPQQLEREILASKEKLSALVGKSVETFCYPYARFSPAAVAVVRKAGYLGAVSVYGQSGASQNDLFALPRTVVRPGTSRLEFKLQATGWYGAWQRLPSLGILSQLRRRKKQR